MLILVYFNCVKSFRIVNSTFFFLQQIPSYKRHWQDRCFFGDMLSIKYIHTNKPDFGALPSLFVRTLTKNDVTKTIVVRFWPGPLLVHFVCKSCLFVHFACLYTLFHGKNFLQTLQKLLPQYFIKRSMKFAWDNIIVYNFVLFLLPFNFRVFSYFYLESFNYAVVCY